MKSFFIRFVRLSRARKIVLILVVLFVVWGAYQLWFKKSVPTYELATARRGTIVQTVSVTGNTAPVHDLDLAFESGGTIVSANYAVGDRVGAGAVIARLDTSDLLAQLAQAQANVDTQTAKLRSLQAGSRPEDIQAAQAALAKAEQDLANMYGSIPNTLADSFAKANDAVRNQLAPFFTNAETNNPQLTFLVSDSQTVNDLQTERLQATTELNAWQDELAHVSAFSATSTLANALAKGAAHLAVIKNLLITANQAIAASNNLSSTTVNSYKTAVTSALTEVNSAATNTSGAAQGIASQKITIEQARATLNLKLAGSTAEDIQAQQAQVEQARASAESIKVKIAKASLASPIAGVVTRQDAKVGQIATPGVVLVSIISDRGLEVDARIPEADIGKVNVGDLATMTLDAFPGKTFSGKIAYIDPGQTVVEGVPTYKTTFQFEGLGPDAKPGMTANIDVTADKHINAVYVPQRAVAAEGGVRKVQIYRGADQPPEKRTVTVGLRDTEGNIEITSGVNEGETVVVGSSR